MAVMENGLPSDCERPSEDRQRTGQCVCVWGGGGGGHYLDEQPLACFITVVSSCRISEINI